MVRESRVKTWVLLRGLTREARHWGSFATVMCRAMPEARVVALDLPGCGLRSDRPSPAQIGSIVECLRDDLRESGTAPPIHLLGLSLGAMVAMEWASRHPKEVAACVLVNTSLGTFNRFHERLRPRTYATLARLALFPLGPRARESAILSLTSTCGDPSGEVIEAWTSYRRELPVSRRNALRQLLAALRYRGSASGPPVPTLVLASEGDRLVNPNCSRALAAQWKVPIEVHPSAGHDLPLDDGAWVAERIREWLRRS